MKPLVFVKTQVRLSEIPQPVDSWELIAIVETPIMHAAWNPLKQALTIQFAKSKEEFVDLPTQEKGKVVLKQRRAELYYRLIIGDLDAIEYILKTFVGNYTNQEWKVTVPEQLEVSAETEEAL